MRNLKKCFCVLMAVSLLVGTEIYAQPIWTDAKTLNANPSENYPDLPASGIQVAYHTQKEICDYVQTHESYKEDAVTYDKIPVVDGNYDMGCLSAETQNSALNMLKQIRYIAGISDQITISDQYTKLAQAASLTNYVNGYMTHYPTKPSDMEDSLYSLGAEGARSSNLFCGYGKKYSLTWAIVDGWMADEDNRNIDRVGHRRWLLNPSMSATGFGCVTGSWGTHSSVYAIDGNNVSAKEYGVCWPAQNMPIEYFSSDYPWSVSTGRIENPSTVQVTLRNNRTGKVWRFSSSSSDGDFFVNNVEYGLSGCIIFRPDRPNIGSSYIPGDCYQVNITGLAGEDISYTVNFFNLYEIEPVEPAIPWFDKEISTPGKFKIYWGKSGLAEGFQMQYSNTPEFKKGKNTKTKNSKEPVLVVKRAKKNQKYFVRIRAYRMVNGKRIYSGWSFTREI